MAQSSIHIESGNLGVISHNDRSKHTSNSIFNDEPNEIDYPHKKAYQIYREELEKRTLAYTQRLNQKLHSKAITHLSAIVNLNKNHNLNDLNELKNYLEKTLDTKVFQIAIHKDEGHIDTNNNQIKNYHAHIEFMGLDTQGNSVRRKLTKSYLSQLQTFTAQSLSMQRGINYTQEKKRRPKRLDTYEYKRHKELETQELTKKQLATTEELKAEIKTLREQLKQNGAIRADYAKLEQFQKELQEQIKSKDLTINQLTQEIQKQREEIQKLNTKLKTSQEDIIYQITGQKIDISKNETNNDLENLRKEVLNLSKTNERLQTNTITALKKQKELQAIIDSKEEEISKLQNSHLHLERENLDLSLEKMTLQTKVDSLEFQLELLNQKTSNDFLTQDEQSSTKKIRF